MFTIIKIRDIKQSTMHKALLIKLQTKQTPRRSEQHDYHNHLSPHWGVFIRKQMLFYSLFCAIIINDNRVCRVVLPSFSMNGGDVYGTILFSRLNVFWNVHDSIAYVHYFEHKKVILHIEKPPLNFAG